MICPIHHILGCHRQHPVSTWERNQHGQAVGWHRGSIQAREVYLVLVSAGLILQPLMSKNSRLVVCALGSVSCQDFVHV